MLRKTKTGYERQDSDGNWQPVTEGEALAATAATAVAPEPEVDADGVTSMIDDLAAELNGGTVKTPSVEEAVRVAEVSQAIDPETPALQSDIDVTPAPGGDFDLEVPGLVSGDTGRSTRGFKTVRERLKENARKRREPKRVEVGAAAARVQGPAAREGTERRQQRKATERLEAGKQVSDGAVKGQRYVQRPAPSLFEGRPKWVADLFEAHFRSEHTLAMRRAHNRMKISRQDYAIGWLTAFDKFREESSLLRLKSKDE